MSFPPYCRLRSMWRTAMASGNAFGSTALMLAVVGLGLDARPVTATVGLACGALAVLFGFFGCVRISRGSATNSAVTLAGVVLGFGATALGVWVISLLSSAMNHLTGPRPADHPADGYWQDGTYLVGNQIPTGTYLSAGAVTGVFPYCHWERLGVLPSGARTVLAAGTDGPGEPVEVTLRAGDWELWVSGCQPFARAR
jgi:hypothetical protein